MRFFKRILVGWAGPDDGAGLARYAGAIAAFEQQPGHIEFLQVKPTPTEPGPAARERLLAEMHAAVAGELDGPASLVRWSCHLRWGDPVDQFLRHSVESDTDLILLGDGRRANPRRAFARRVAGLAPCSAWIVPHEAPPRVSRVLAAADFSPCSSHAVRWAARIASGCGAEEFFALHVRAPFANAAAPSSEEALASLLAAIEQPGGAAGPRPLVVEAPTAAQAILEAARRLSADLIVMGDRGSNPASAVLLGSEVEQTLRESPFPVLIIKPPGPPMPLVEALLDSATPPPADS